MIVEQRKNRQTGTMVYLNDRGADDEEVLDGFNRWETICDDHGTVCSHETRALARSFLAVPLEWCEVCADIEQRQRR
jgi:hypothetical protein